MTRRWTDDDLVLMWQLGRDHGLATAHEALTEAQQAGMAPPHRTPQQRYLERLAQSHACAIAAGRPPYTGGPAPWGPR
jgi:hypothetical protein